MVSSVMMRKRRISRERSSRVEMIFMACPGIRGDTVLIKRRFGPENFTSTSAMGDLEFAKSSLALSLMEEVVEEDEGDSSREVGMVGER